MKAKKEDGYYKYKFSKSDWGEEGTQDVVKIVDDVIYFMADIRRRRIKTEEGSEMYVQEITSPIVDYNRHGILWLKKKYIDNYDEFKKKIKDKIYDIDNDSDELKPFALRTEKYPNGYYEYKSKGKIKIVKIFNNTIITIPIDNISLTNVSQGGYVADIPVGNQNINIGKQVLDILDQPPPRSGIHKDGGTTCADKKDFNKIGIDWQDRFSSDDEATIESDIQGHIADMVGKGNTSGDLSGNLGKGEPAPYRGAWKITIEKDDNDEEIRNEEVVKKIRDGYTSGHNPTFSWSANVWSEMADGGKTKLSKDKISESLSISYILSFIFFLNSS